MRAVCRTPGSQNGIRDPRTWYEHRVLGYEHEAEAGRPAGHAHRAKIMVQWFKGLLCSRPTRYSTKYCEDAYMQ